MGFKIIPFQVFSVQELQDTLVLGFTAFSSNISSRLLSSMMIPVFSMRFVFEFNPACHLFFPFFGLFQWEFYSQDTNHNDILDEDEIESMIDRDEECMVGFMKSCDYDHQKGISIREWNTCFPPVAASEYIRATGGRGLRIVLIGLQVSVQFL